MDLVNHLDFWLMVVTFAFLFYYFVWKKIEHWTWAIVSWMIWSIISAFRDGHEVMSSENDFDEAENNSANAPVPDTRAVPDVRSVPVPNESEPMTGRDITLSQHTPPNDEVVFLAVLKNDDGSYRHTANAIAQLMGGRRGDVLELIRQVREPAPSFKSAPRYLDLDENRQPVGVKG